MAVRSDTPRLAGVAVLVVEDHADSCELLARLLTHEGALVLSAHDGWAGLRMLRLRTPDVILTDLRMPGLGGLAFARRVKADARWTEVPIIAVTALDVHATVEDGFAAHMTKPIDWETLTRTIERVLAAARTRSAQRRRRRRP